MAAPRSWAACPRTADNTTWWRRERWRRSTRWWSICCRWCRRGGLAVVYKGGSAPQEFIEARKAIELLGGDAVRFAPVEVPYLDESRYVLLIKKIRHTPDLYPRGQGLARKQPLK